MLFHVAYHIILSLLLFACTTHSTILHNPKKHKTVYLNFISSPLSIDPRKSTDPITVALSQMLYEGLTHLESDGSVTMALAEHITVSSDQTTYTFYLKKSFWSDGTPLKASDFAASWQTILHPTSPVLTAHLLFPIQHAKEVKEGKRLMQELGVQALDDITLRVKLTHPIPYFLQLVSCSCYFPIAPHQQNEACPTSKQEKKWISNGPFLLESWEKHDKIVLKKNISFWNAQDVQLDYIYISLIPDEMTAFNLFEQNRLDLIGGNLSPIPLDALPSLLQEKKIETHPATTTTFCAFNIHSPPFNHPSMRKAFGYAINRQALVLHILQIFHQPACGLIPPSIYSQMNQQPDNINHVDLAQHHFQTALEELNIQKEDLPALTYSFYSGDISKKVALFLQNQWETVLGVKVHLQAYEFKVFIDKLHRHDFQFALMSWIAQYNDPMSFLERFLSKTTYRNYTGWEHPLFVTLIERSFYQNAKKRLTSLLAAEQCIIDEMPIFPLYHYDILYLKNPHLKNVTVSPLGHIELRYADI